MPRPLWKIPAVGQPKPNPRERAIAAWRGADVREFEKAAAVTARSACDVMPGVLAMAGLDRKRGEAEILRVWNHLIDPNIVAHAHPVGIRNGTLFVNVDSSVWLSEIVRYRQREILQRLQSSFGRDLITRISFRIG